MTDPDRQMHFMRQARWLAMRALGRVAPSPAVGCVVTRDGLPVGRGWTQPGGRPHAEAMALANAGAAARGATAWVSLEPCAHEGRGPSCARSLIEAGIVKVVSAMTDPDPRTNGKGHAMLREAGIELVTGIEVEEKQARALNAGYCMRLEHKRPMVTLKMAASLDGRIAAADGRSQWITGPLARARAHLLRAQHDAIMIGSRTALADDPSLTCRLPGGEALSPVRIIADSRLALSPKSKLAAGEGPPVWIFARPDADPRRRKTLAACGVEIIEAPAGANNLIDLRQGLNILANRGITRLLVEGGGQLAASFLQEGLVDRLAWFAAPLLLGGQGRAAIAEIGAAALEDAPRFGKISFDPIASDILIEGVKTPDRK